MHSNQTMESNQTARPSLTLFYDGDCPLCKREIDWIRKRTESVYYIDISDGSFNPSVYDSELTLADCMNEIHGLDAEGKLIRGFDVFRLLYSAAGFKSLVALSRLPLVREIVDTGYRFFARYRLRLTGRSHCSRCVS